jgi:hypothetical protein
MSYAVYATIPLGHCVVRRNRRIPSSRSIFVPDGEENGFRASDNERSIKLEAKCSVHCLVC